MILSAKATTTLILALVAAGCAAGSATASKGPAAEAAGSGPAPAPGAAPRATAAPAASPGPPVAAPAPAAAPAAARPRLRPPAALVGTWRPTDAPPGAGAAAPARPGAGDEIGLEFRADGTWTIAGASYRSAGTYRWLDGDEIEMTIVESNLSSQVGSVSRRRVTVDATDLALTVERQDDKGQAGGLAVVTRFRRAGR